MYIRFYTFNTMEVRRQTNFYSIKYIKSNIYLFIIIILYIIHKQIVCR